MSLQLSLYYSGLGFFALTVFRFVCSYVKWLTSPLRKIPGPNASSYFYGVFFQIFKEPFMSPHQRWWKQALEKNDNKNVPLLQYSTFFGRYSVIVLDADVVQSILMETSAYKNPVRYPKKFLMLKETLGNGLVTLEGEDWSRHRRIIQPCFNPGFVKDALNEAVPDLTAKLLQAWKCAGDQEILVESHMSALTLDIIGRVAFSLEFHALDVLNEWANDTSVTELPSTAADPLIQALQDSMRPGISFFLSLALGMPWLEKYINPKLQRTRRLLREAADNVIQNARQDEDSSAAMTDDSSTRRSKSLLQLLLNAKDAEPGARKSLSDGELRDEIKTFVVAGHETTATWCYWALYALAKHPDVQQKLYEDILANVAPDGKNQLDWETVEPMSYFDAFLNEVLRLYSPVGLIYRFTSQTEHLAGYTIPPNTRIVLPFFLLHRHPDYWTNPYEFSSERWLQHDNKRHRFAFLPFSAGPRNCIGQRFAQVEVKLILANIVQSFSIQLAPSVRDKDIEFSTVGTMKAKPAVKIVVKAR